MRRTVSYIILLVCLILLIQSFTPARAEEKHKYIIRNIEIEVREIFDGPGLNSTYQAINGLKIPTQEYVIRRELLFKEGDAYDHFLIHESERNLRSLRYLRQVEIFETFDGDYVDLKVSTQDTWTIIPQTGYSSGDGKDGYMVGLAESNLLGLGKRLEVLYKEDETRESYEAVYDDSRFWGTKNRLLAAFFDRNDGDRGVFSFGKPFRSFVDKYSWSVNVDSSDGVGRLFEDSDESYIYALEREDVSAKYIWAFGNPEKNVRRFALGYQFVEEDFTQADQQDYDDLDLDPETVSNDLSMLAQDRKYSGPIIGYESIAPDFVSMNYIDRFDRVDDYNLGDQFAVGAQIAPEVFGSEGDSFLFSTNRGAGVRFAATEFLRGELGAGSRWDSDGLSNSLIRAEMKYYNVIGPLYFGERFLGRHTLASSFFIDYGDDLDKDRQFLVGGDNALRGYKARTFTGDKRLVLNIEDRVHFIDDAFKLVSLGGAMFIDAGAASDSNLGEILQDEIYSDIGVGLRVAFPRSVGGRIARIDLAFPMRDGPDGSNSYEIRVILAGGQLFDSRTRSESQGLQNSNLGVGFDR